MVFGLPTATSDEELHKSGINLVKLILNALLWHAAWLTRNFCH